MTTKNMMNLLVIVILSVTACDAGNKITDNPPKPQPVVVKVLTAYASCDDFLVDVKAATIKQMEESLGRSLECYSDDYGDEEIGSGGDVSTTADSAPASDAAEDDEGVSFTDTNLQEAGVDEADIMKTDGAFAYVVVNGGVDIYQVLPMDEFGRVGNVTLETTPSNIFLQNGILVALSSDYNESWMSRAIITLVDVSNPETPQVIAERDLPGNLTASRIVNDVLHLGLTSVLQLGWNVPDYSWEDYQASCDGNAAATERLTQQIAAAIEENRTQIESLTLEDVITIQGDGNSLPVDCSGFYTDGTDDQVNASALFSMNLDLSREQLSLIKGWTSELYGTTESIYLVSSNGWYGDADQTQIHRFALDENAALHHYTGSGAVAGHINNTFSLSEAEGYFRIATTTGEVFSDAETSAENHLFILDATQPEMLVVGQINGLAPNEKIYSARFIGDKAYVVTFKKVDPLYVIDVSDPTNPAVQGELKVPGYSTYLHALDENHLMGLGKDAEDVGDFAWYAGMKISLFDVTDAMNPFEDDNIIIGSRGTDSTALYDHHAFTFDPDTGLLALPISLYEGSESSSDYGEFAYNGVHLYTISADGGIVETAKIVLGDDEYDYYSQPLRTFFVNDNENNAMYILSSDRLSVIDMNDDYKIIASESFDPATGKVVCY